MSNQRTPQDENATTGKDGETTSIEKKDHKARFDGKENGQQDAWNADR